MAENLQIGFAGLGRMGKNMVKRLLGAHHSVVVWNRSPGPVEEAAKEGAIPASTLKELAQKLESKPRVVWFMLPAGDVTEEKINEIVPFLDKGDIIIDGGNSDFHDSLRRHRELAEKGLLFLDIGVSGGLEGAKSGYCMMVGGSPDAYETIKPFLDSLCMKEGYAYMGEGGSGHYVKMVHNAIEYGMMQAIAEGFDLLANGRFKNLDLLKISRVWNHGSIVRSFLMECAEKSFEHSSELSGLKPFVQDSGEGKWAAIEAVEHSVPFVVNTYALHARYISRQDNSFAFRILAAMRNVFGGHPVKRPEESK